MFFSVYFLVNNLFILYICMCIIFFYLFFRRKKFLFCVWGIVFFLYVIFSVCGLWFWSGCGGVRVIVIDIFFWILIFVFVVIVVFIFVVFIVVVYVECLFGWVFFVVYFVWFIVMVRINYWGWGGWFGVDIGFGIYIFMVIVIEILVFVFNIFLFLEEFWFGWMNFVIYIVWFVCLVRMRVVWFIINVFCFGMIICVVIVILVGVWYFLIFLG